MGVVSRESEYIGYSVGRCPNTTMADFIISSDGPAGLHMRNMGSYWPNQLNIDYIMYTIYQWNAK